MEKTLSSIRLYRFAWVVITLAVALWGHRPVLVQANANARPNFIVFLVDDYDKYEASVYGGKVLTPNLDRMAQEGMTFYNAHVTSTVCTPSRYTFLTGRYAGSSHSPIFTSLFPPGQQSFPGFNVSLEEDNMNVGAVLAKHGYATGFVGKYHVGAKPSNALEAKALGLHHVPKNVPFSKTINTQQFENEKRYRQLVKQRGFTWAKNIYWDNTKAPFQSHNPEWTVQAAVEFIETHKDKPFYLHYCTTLVHGPNGSWHKSLSKPRVTGEGIIDHDLNAMPSRTSVTKRVAAAGLTANQDGYTWMDDSLGVLLKKLDDLKLADNTVILFIADHGSNNKGSLYKKRGTEVPCLIRWPKGIKAASRCDELIQNTDFVPTWFELAGIKPKGYKHDGVSIAPLFKDATKPIRNHVYAEMGAARSIKTKQFSYIALRYSQDQIEGVRAGKRQSLRAMSGLSGGVSRALPTHPAALSYDQLYDLRQDADAQNNLANDSGYKRKLKEMKRLLTKELKRFPNRPFGEFIPGGNAVPGKGYDDVFKAVRNDAGAKKKAKKNTKKK